MEAELSDTENPALKAFADANAPLVQDALEAAWAAAEDVTLLSVLRANSGIASQDAGLIIKRAVRLLPSRIRRQATIHVHLDDELIVLGDSSRFLTALTELLRNAALSIDQQTGECNEINIRGTRKRTLLPETLERCPPGAHTIPELLATAAT